MEFQEVVAVQGRQETVGINPNPDALGQDVPVDRPTWMQIGTQETIVFGLNGTEVYSQLGHATEAVGEQNGRIGRWN